jgi:hypothetical protein
MPAVCRVSKYEENSNPGRPKSSEGPAITHIPSSNAPVCSVAPLSGHLIKIHIYKSATANRPSAVKNKNPAKKMTGFFNSLSLGNIRGFFRYHVSRY